MIEDFRTFEDDTLIEADLCVIGAGAAGVTIAREFIGSRPRVCLVESGGFDFELETQSLYEGQSVGLPLRVMDKRLLQGMDAGRLRFFGGTTNGWAGICAPLEETDFQARSWVPYSGWPITKADLDPWYERAYQVCGLDPNFYREPLFRTIGKNLPELRISRLHVHAWQFASVRRFSKAYRSELNDAKNVLVLLYANATNIQTNAVASVVEHVDLCALVGKRGRIKAKTFVLACGGIENPRLLLLSNHVEPNGLGNRRDLVGRFFMDHPRCRCGVLTPLDNRAFQEVFDHYWLEHWEMSRLGLALGYATQRSHHVANCVTYMHRPPLPPGWPRAREIATLGEPPSVSNSSSLGVPDLIYLLADVEQVPNPDSRVTLSPDRDSLGLNRARVEWRLTELEGRTVEMAARTVGAELRRLNLARVQLDSWLIDGGEDWTLNLHDVFHHMGTTRMADDPRDGVVSKDCCVHDVANLYVAGSSVFPTSGHANPTLTIVALALRLAHHLKGLLA